MKEAIKRAKEFLKEKSVDKEVIDEMEVNLNKIKKNEKIIAWWN